MKIRLAGEINDSIVDGPGIRYTIFFQGCYHNCPECHNQHTHDPNGGYESDTEIVLDKIKSNFLLDGVTFSGGEPLLQINACIEIAKHCKLYGLNVLCYTGFTYEQAIQIKGFNELVEYLDFLIDGRYEKNLRDLSLRFRGSRNQRIIDIQKTKKEGKIISIE